MNLQCQMPQRQPQWQPQRPQPRVALALAAAMLGGCATWGPGGWPVGTPIAQARQAWQTPTGEYAMPGGGTRLEYAQGTFGTDLHA